MTLKPEQPVVVPENKCRMCEQPEAAHRIVFWDGVAHTVAHSADGKAIYCSQQYADRDYYQGQILALSAVVRSLRMRAGRLRSRGWRWEPDHLVEYSDKLVKDIERFRKILSRWS
jgi:hypothetical protein